MSGKVKAVEYTVMLQIFVCIIDCVYYYFRHFAVFDLAIFKCALFAYNINLAI